MAEIAETQTIKPRNVTVGGDTYKGVRTISYTKNSPEVYPVILEGELQPSAYEPIESTRPAVEFTVTSMSESVLLDMIDETGSLTVDYKIPGTSTDRTLTFANARFTTGRGEIQQLRSGEYQVSGVATDVTAGAAGG